MEKKFFKWQWMLIPDCIQSPDHDVTLVPWVRAEL